MKNQVSVRNFLRLLLIDAIVLALLRLIVTLCGCQPNAEPAVQNAGEVSLPVLMYHSIRRGPQTDYAVTPDTLEDDLRYIQQLGWETVSPEQLVNFVFYGVPLPEKPVLLTFDDGFYNNLVYALPLLEQFDMCANVNVVGEFSRELAENDAHTAAYSYLTAADLRELSASGRITIGNHTDMMHHISERMGCRIMQSEPEEQYQAVLRSDITALQRFLYQETGRVPFVFAYPYGFDCPESETVLHELGFLVTLSCREKVNRLTHDAECLYGLGRYNRSGLESTESYFSHILSDFPAEA